MFYTALSLLAQRSEAWQSYFITPETPLTAQHH
jgi:hypothetical protein